jgi:hypothetical protein
MRLRHELKYSMSVEQAQSLFQDLRGFCVPDPFTGESGCYEVASLYYDTEDFQFYWDREESVGYRRKIRLRSYNSEEGCKGLFLEIKEKHRNLVAKKRASLPFCISPEEVRQDRIALSRIVSELEDCAEAREIGYLNSRLRLQPVSIVRYVRDILVSDREKGLRITFDRRLTTGGHDLFRYSWNKEVFIHPPQLGILEIKANIHIPVWLQTILARYELVQSRFSKYCLAVKTSLGEVPRYASIPQELQTTPLMEREPFKEASGM